MTYCVACPSRAVNMSLQRRQFLFFGNSSSSVTGRGRTAPSDTIQGSDTRMNFFFWGGAEFTEDLEKRWNLRRRGWEW